VHAVDAHEVLGDRVRRRVLLGRGAGDAEEEVARAAEGLQIILREPAAVPHLKAVLGQIGKGRGKISILVELEPMREAEIQIPGGYAVSAKSRAAIKSIAGVSDVLDL